MSEFLPASSEKLDDKLLKNFRAKLIDFFYGHFDKRSVFCLRDDLVAVITEDEWGNEAEKVITDFPGSFKIEEYEFSTNMRAIELDSHNFRTSSDVRHVIETILQERSEGGVQRVSELTRETLDRRDYEVKIVQCVRHALKNGGFEIYYQPILEEKSGKYVSAEALIRLKNTLNGKSEFITPSVFIPLAEQNGLIIQIGSGLSFTRCGFQAPYLVC